MGSGILYQSNSQKLCRVIKRTLGGLWKYYALQSLSNYFCLAYLWFYIVLVISSGVLITEKRAPFIETWQERRQKLVTVAWRIIDNSVKSVLKHTHTHTLYI